MTDLAKEVDAFISMYTHTPNKQAANDGYASSSRVTSSIMSPALTNSLLHISSELYKRFQHTHGMDSADTIKAGLNYAKVLQSVSCIEAERLVTKLAAISRRVHGPDHKITIELVKLLKECKVRFLFCLRTNRFRLCDTKMMEKSVLLQVQSQCQSVYMMIQYVLTVIS